MRHRFFLYAISGGDLFDGQPRDRQGWLISSLHVPSALWEVELRSTFENLYYDHQKDCLALWI